MKKREKFYLNYFANIATKVEEEYKMLESKLQFDARKTGKKLKLTKLGRETEFKLKDNEIQH